MYRMWQNCGPFGEGPTTVAKTCAPSVNEKNMEVTVSLGGVGWGDCKGGLGYLCFVFLHDWVSRASPSTWTLCLQGGIVLGLVTRLRHRMSPPPPPLGRKH